MTGGGPAGDERQPYGLAEPPRTMRITRRAGAQYPCVTVTVAQPLAEPRPAPSEAPERSLATTNAAESLISRTRHVKRNVKRWRGGQMMLRWVAAGVLEAA